MLPHVWFVSSVPGTRVQQTPVRRFCSCTRAVVRDSGLKRSACMRVGNLRISESLNSGNAQAKNRNLNPSNLTTNPASTISGAREFRSPPTVRWRPSRSSRCWLALPAPLRPASTPQRSHTGPRRCVSCDYTMLPHGCFSAQSADRPARALTLAAAAGCSTTCRYRPLSCRATRLGRWTRSSFRSLESWTWTGRT